MHPGASAINDTKLNDKDSMTSNDNDIHPIYNTIQSDAPGCIPTIRTALSVVVGGYKQSVTMFARRNGIIFEWQPRYHDHIIRGVADGNKIADYIENNIIHWDTDCFNK